MKNISRSGMIVDIVNEDIFPGTIHILDGRIDAVTRTATPENNTFLLPGFIDSHVHIESSMLVPSEFARLASVHGTVATVSDPHEIANVLGMPGIRYMIDNGAKVPFHFYFGASSCVPATTFETAGATISAEDIETLFKEDGIKYLSEMMNYPGVLNSDPTVMAKLQIAKKWHRPIDGHAPGLRGAEATAYIQAGISTDHECFTFDEAFEKVSQGMHILIREGSAAKNYEALHPLIAQFPSLVMFCSDDKHPHELVKGHINALVRRSLVEKKYPLYDVLRIATLNPIMHYGLDVGLLRPGDCADFIVIDNLQNLTILETFIKGQCVARQGRTLINSVTATAPNNFTANAKQNRDFHLPAKDASLPIHVIQPEDGQLVTRNLTTSATILNGAYVADPARNILKITVVNRYCDAPPAVAFITNFGLKYGAIASSIAHDSHNIIAVGCSDEEIAKAVNAIIQARGGIAVAHGDMLHLLPLPVAGIMSNEDGYHVADQYSAIDLEAKALGSKLSAPFMTLSFMALLVIPALKLSDKGLFDGNAFAFTPFSNCG